jgi:hypothetical protein
MNQSADDQRRASSSFLLRFLVVGPAIARYGMYAAAIGVEAWTWDGIRGIVAVRLEERGAS